MAGLLRLFALSFAVVLCSPVLVVAAEPDKPPEAGGADKVFQELYGKEYDRAVKSRDAGVKVALAEKLLDAARKAGSVPGLDALLCERACELGAADPTGYDTAMSAVDLLADKAPGKAQALQETVLVIRERQYKTSPAEWKSGAAEAYADCLIATALAKAHEGDMGEAQRRCARAQQVAREARLTEMESLESQIRRLQELQKVVGTIPRLKATLKTEPANPKARGDLIHLFLVELDNPAEGLKYLDESCDENVRRYLPAAAKDGEGAPALANMELAQWYYQLATEASPCGKAAMLTRAQTYYERFLKMHPEKDADRAKAELALDSIKADFAKAAQPRAKYVPTFGRGQWIDLLKLLDPAKDGVMGTFERQDDGVRLVGSGAIGGWRRLTAPPVLVVGDYDLEVTFMLRGGTWEVKVLLPVGSSAVMLNWYEGRDDDQPKFTLESISGSKDTRAKAPRLETKRSYTFNVQVRTGASKAAIAVFLDGKSVLKWSGPESAITPPRGDYRAADVRRVGLGYYVGDVVYQKARLRMLSGKAVPVR